MWVIAIVIGLPILILLVCCIPLEVTFDVQAAGRPEFGVSIRWGFGLLRTKLTTNKTPRERQRRTATQPTAQKRQVRPATVRRLLARQGSLTQLRRLALDILRCLKLKELKADLSIGLDDPADTGLLFALLGPVVVFVRFIRGDQIRVMPAFEAEPVLQGYARGTVGLQPIRLIPPFVRFIFSLPTLPILKVLMVDLWKKQS